MITIKRATEMTFRLFRSPCYLSPCETLLEFLDFLPKGCVDYDKKITFVKEVLFNRCLEVTAADIAFSRAVENAREIAENAQCGNGNGNGNHTQDAAFNGF